MTCAIAISNSPVFSPSSSSSSSSPAFFYKHNNNPFSSRVSSPSASRLNSSSSSSCSLSSVNGFRSSVVVVADVPSTSKFSAPVPLKRKRPARLDIPTLPLGFGAPAETPIAENSVEEERDGAYSVYCKRGKRRAVMEDRYSAVVNLQDDSKQAFFGVFDGHGGFKAAEFAAKNIEKNIMDEVVAKMNNDSDSSDLKEAVKQGYLKTDSDFLKEDSRGGSCCVTALIRNGNLVVSNAGDCRAVISRGGVAEALTSDHRPSRKEEKSRIEAAGGYIDCYNGVWRVQGSLAVSRGIGDGHFKQWVIAEPETGIHSIKHDDEFLILASDGLWDKVSNQEAVDIARPLCIGKTSKPEMLAACKKLVDLSASRGSFDDISVMLIQLQNYM